MKKRQITNSAAQRLNHGKTDGITIALNIKLLAGLLVPSVEIFQILVKVT